MSQAEVIKFLKEKYLVNQNVFFTPEAIALSLKKDVTRIRENLRKLFKHGEVEKIEILYVQKYLKNNSGLGKKIVRGDAYRYKS